MYNIRHHLTHNKCDVMPVWFTLDSRKLHVTVSAFLPRTQRRSLSETNQNNRKCITNQSKIEKLQTTIHLRLALSNGIYTHCVLHILSFVDKINKSNNSPCAAAAGTYGCMMAFHFYNRVVWSSSLIRSQFHSDTTNYSLYCVDTRELAVR